MFGRKAREAAAKEVRARSVGLPSGMYQSDGGRYYAVRRKGAWWVGGDRYDDQTLLDNWPWHRLIREDGTHTPVNDKDAV